MLLLQSADITVETINQLDDYIDPRLDPVPTQSAPRKYWKAEQNDLNAWSHRTDLLAQAPTSSLLKGRTIAIKDNMSVAGLPTTIGTFPQLTSKDGNYPISPIDAIVVRRILEAGGHIIGTSTCENYSLTPLSYSSATGPVHSPWLRNHNVGGSSSGAAALLSLSLARSAGIPGLSNAGDMVDIAMGGDQGGSIRLPAAYTGCYGFKPTHGLIPYTGIAPLYPLYDHVGPMATNLDDIALMLSVLAGYDGLDPRMTPESPLRPNLPDYLGDLTRFTDASAPETLGANLKVGIITESLLPAAHTTPAVARLLTTTATTHFTNTSATVNPVSIPLHTLAPAIWTAATRPHLASTALASHPPPLLSHPLPHLTPRWPPDQETYTLLTHANPAVINVLFSATYLDAKTRGSGADVAKAHRHVLQLRAAYDAALATYDVLVTPTAPGPAPRHPDMRLESDGGAGVMDKIKLALGQTNQTCPFNVTGHPAISVPCGWVEVDGGEEDGKDGREGGGGGGGRERKWLPVGMQIIGRRWDEAGVLRAARCFEAGGGGLGAWPGKEGWQGNGTGGVSEVK